jgi:hypothetical protein
MRKIIVNKKYDGKKLNTFLLDNFNGLTLNTIYKTLRKKDIRINNVKISENCIVHEGDEITIYLTDDLLFKTIKLDIIYEDTNIIVVNKPIGIEVVSNKPEEVTLTKYIGCDMTPSIPETVAGYNVTTIGSACFKGTKITSVYIPKTVTKIAIAGAIVKSALEVTVFLRVSLEIPSSFALLHAFLIK